MDSVHRNEQVTVHMVSPRKMLAKGYNCEHVSDILELAVEEVRKIQEGMA